MRRDLDLIRKMLLKIEDAPTAWAPEGLSIEGYSPAQVAYHAHLLIEAGFAEGAVLTYMESEGPEARITNLTWAGHELAEKLRNDTVWHNTMAIVKEKGGAVTIQILSQLLTVVMKQHFGVP